MMNDRKTIPSRTVETQHRRIPFNNLKSVELFVDELNRIYQFKLWGNALTSMFVLVREDSEILGQLNVGKTFHMKYYGQDSVGPIEILNTRIKYIDKVDEGRFRGHYLTGLTII